MLVPWATAGRAKMGMKVPITLRFLLFESDNQNHSELKLEEKSFYIRRMDNLQHACISLHIYCKNYFVKMTISGA